MNRRIKRTTWFDKRTSRWVTTLLDREAGLAYNHQHPFSVQSETYARRLGAKVQFPKKEAS